LCVSELIVCGAAVSNRFIRRFASSDAIDLLKSLKLVHHAASPSFPSPTSVLEASSGAGISSVGGVGVGVGDWKAPRMTLEVDICESMYRVPSPSSSLYDVIFSLADGEECEGHSFIISYSSEVLKAMLMSDMLRVIEDDGGNMMAVISLPYHTKDTFSMVIEWMYELKDVTDIFELSLVNHQAALLDLLYLSNELIITPLQRLCEHRIGKHLEYFDKETVYLLLRIYSYYYFSHITRRNIQLISDVKKFYPDMGQVHLVHQGMGQIHPVYWDMGQIYPVHLCIPICCGYRILREKNIRSLSGGLFHMLMMLIGVAIW
jgi:hypothetical protein